LNLPDEEFDISFMDTVLKPETEEDKTGIVDIKVKTASGKVIDVEIQVNPFPELGKRISFYKSKLVVGQIGEGERYDVIRQVICVCILDHMLFPEAEEYLNRFRFYNPENGLCFKGIPEEIYTIELPKVPAKSDGRTVWDWMQFLKGKRKEEFDISFMDTVLKPEAEEDKMGIVDIKVKTASGKILDVEIQLNPFPYLEQRISFYKSKLIVEQIKEGEKYDVIRQVICVCILDYALFPEAKEYLNRFRFYNPENGMCFKGIPEVIYTIELPKVPVKSDGRTVWDWMQFLRGKRKEEFEMVAERNREVRGAVDMLYRLSEDPEVRARMEYREKARKDHATLLHAAIQEGKALGEALGEARGKALGEALGEARGKVLGEAWGEARSRAEIARNLKRRGRSIDQIAEDTGLSAEEIAKL
jgi:predicted transposase/invertase (TIGR01784 family)